MAAKKTGLIALVVILVAAAAGGGWWWMNKMDGPGSANPDNSADQPLTAELPPSPDATPPPTAPSPTSAEQFDLAAVIEDPNGFTNVHSGPSTVAPIVARVSEGEAFTTYEQGDDWWRVRTAGGLIGFMPRRRISLQGEAPAMPAATPPIATTTPTVVPGQAVTTNATPNAAPVAQTPRATSPRPRPVRRSRINRANSANMRAFCQNAGRGTPQCRAFTRELRGR